MADRAPRRAYDAVIFDFDGTLGATRPAVVACMAATFARFGLEPPVPAIEAQIAAGRDLAAAFQAMLPAAIAAAPRQVARWVELYRAIYAEIGLGHTAAFDGAKEAMAALDSAGVACLVISNKGPAALSTALDHLGFSRHLRLVAGDVAGIARKPSPEVFTKVIAPAFPAIAPGRFLMVGDTVADLRFARNAAIGSCWAAYGYGRREECRALTPDHVIERLADLPAIALGTA